MGDDIGSGLVCFDFAVVQLCTAEYVCLGQKRTLKDNLSLNPNQCHHPLNTQLKIMETMMIVIREQKPRRNGSPKKLNFSDYLPNLKVKSKFMASSDGENIQGEHYIKS